jgi:hypothetical protein
MSLVRVYPFRLKLLQCIPPHSLCSVLETMTTSQFQEAIELLKRDLRDGETSDLLWQMGAERIDNFLATLRWSLVSTGCSTLREVQFDALTVERIVHLKIPFNPSNESLIRELLPDLLEFDGPPGEAKFTLFPFPFFLLSPPFPFSY